MRKILLIVFVMLSAAGPFAQGKEYGKTVFMDDVSLGTWEAIAGIEAGPVGGGVYTNGVQTNFYRMSGLNRKGRLPVSTNIIVSFTGNAETNAVRLTWPTYGGLSSYVIERSLDAGATWDHWLTLGPRETAWTDTGTNAWTNSVFTNLYAIIPDPSFPWPAVGADDLGSHTATTTLDMAGHDISGADEVDAQTVHVALDASNGTEAVNYQTATDLVAQATSEYLPLDGSSPMQAPLPMIAGSASYEVSGAEAVNGLYVPEAERRWMRTDARAIMIVDTNAGHTRLYQLADGLNESPWYWQNPSTNPVGGYTSSVPGGGTATCVADTSSITSAIATVNNGISVPGDLVANAIYFRDPYPEIYFTTNSGTPPATAYWREYYDGTNLNTYRARDASGNYQFYKETAGNDWMVRDLRQPGNWFRWVRDHAGGSEPMTGNYHNEGGAPPGNMTFHFMSRDEAIQHAREKRREWALTTRPEANGLVLVSPLEIEAAKVDTPEGEIDDLSVDRLSVTETATMPHVVAEDIETSDVAAKDVATDYLHSWEIDLLPQYAQVVVTGTGMTCAGNYMQGPDVDGYDAYYQVGDSNCMWRANGTGPWFITMEPGGYEWFIGLFPPYILGSESQDYPWDTGSWSGTWPGGLATNFAVIQGTNPYAPAKLVYHFGEVQFHVGSSVYPIGPSITPPILGGVHRFDADGVHQAYYTNDVATAVLDASYRDCVTLGPGYYGPGPYLRIYTNITIRGSGAGSCHLDRRIRAYADTTIEGIDVSYTATSTMLRLEPNVDVVLRDCRITHTNEPSGGIFAFGTNTTLTTYYSDIAVEIDGSPGDMTFRPYFTAYVPTNVVGNITVEPQDGPAIEAALTRLSVTNSWIDHGGVTNAQVFVNGLLDSWTTNGVPMP